MNTPAATACLRFVTSIPTSYRIHEFTVLAEACSKRDMRLEVRFLAHSQRDIRWKYEAAAFPFDHRFASGPTVYPRPSVPVHLTLGPWAEQLTAPPRWLVLGGNWYQPAVLASGLRTRAGTALLWNESHEQGRGWTGSVKRRLYGRLDGSVVPGARAEALSGEYSAHPVLRMPNTVDEAAYRDEVAARRARRRALRARWGADDGTTVFLLPARLIPEKGIVPFLEAVGTARGQWLILIAGEGSQRPQIEETIRTLGLSGRVRLLGHQWMDPLLDLYAGADAFVLPSLVEPYGFVAVEALWAGLPLLLSERVGALPEALDGNGWSFDPYDPAAMRSAFEAAVGVGPEALARLGERSVAVAEERFASRSSAERFVDELLVRFPL